MSGAYIIKRSIIENPETKPNYIYNLVDADIAMTTNMRRKVSL